MDVAQELAAKNELIALARHEMERALDVRVPIGVDVKVGDNWLGPHH